MPDKDRTSMMLRGILNMRIQGNTRPQQNVSQPAQARPQGEPLSCLQMRPNGNQIVEIVQKLLISTNSFSVSYTNFPVKQSL